MKKFYPFYILFFVLIFASCNKKDPCENFICPVGYVCVDGVCVDDPNYNPCLNVTCPIGEICEDGVCVNDSNYVCDVCGTYTGTTSGNIAIQIIGVDTTFVGLPTTTVVTHVAGPTHNLAIDISALLGVPAGTLVVDVDGVLNSTDMNITDQTYNYGGVANIEIDGVASFNSLFTFIEWDIVLGSDAVGAITFVGNK